MQILNDFSTTVRKALKEIDPDWESYPGLVVCGTHSPHDVEEMIESIRITRELGQPFLGICFGHQLAAVEYARNVLGHTNATSEEWGVGDFVVRKRPEGLKVGLHDGETWWNKYEVVQGFDDMWRKAPNFITCQFHPEYGSSIDRPHPVLLNFINACREYVKRN